MAIDPEVFSIHT